MVIQNCILINFKCHLYKIIFVLYNSHPKLNISLYGNNELKFPIKTENTKGCNFNFLCLLMINIYIYMFINKTYKYL